MNAQLPDVDEVREVVMGRRASIARGEAFAILATLEIPDREPLLATVLMNARERPSVRAGAAIALGRIPTARSERALLEAMQGADPPLLNAILRSLGRVGSRATLPRIDALSLPPGHRVAGAASFAAALISHRLGVEGHDLPFPDSEQLLPTARANQMIEVTQPTTEERAVVLEGLSRQPYGIGLDNASMVELGCLQRTNTICFNQELVDGAPSLLLERKLLAGLVALRSPETGAYSVSYLILTAPNRSPRHIDILMPDGSGPLALAGQGEIAGQGLTFSLVAVKRPGALAMTIAGAFDGRQVTFTSAMYSREREPKLQPSLGSQR